MGKEGMHLRHPVCIRTCREYSLSGIGASGFKSPVAIALPLLVGSMQLAMASQATQRACCHTLSRAASIVYVTLAQTKSQM